MDITQAEILNLIRYASNLIGARVDLFPEDIVNDAILQSLESKQETNLKGIIKILVYGEKNVGRNSGRKDDLYRAYSTTETTKFCKGCNQDLPIASFRVLRYKKINKEIIQHLCKTCTNKYYQDRRKNDDAYRLEVNRKSREQQQKTKIMKMIEQKKYLKRAHSVLERGRAACKL